LVLKKYGELPPTYQVVGFWRFTDCVRIPYTIQHDTSANRCSY